MAATILQLSQLISTSAAQLVDACAAQGFKLPELSDTFTPESEAFRKHPTAAKAANDIVAAAFQLIACVLPPQESTLQLSSAHYKSAALRAAVELNVPEILREAGEHGLHADDIAAKAGVNGPKLSRLLRILSNRHIFREVKEDMFVNNRISSSLDTGKSYEQLSKEPEAKHDGTYGIIAYVELMCDEGHKGSAYILETLKDPVTAHSGEPQHAPLMRSLGLIKTTFDWYAEPSQAYRYSRFNKSMNTWADTQLLEVFDWQTLPNDALIVDVGGGIGELTRLIAAAYSKPKFVVQDTFATIEDAKNYWNEEYPQAIESGRVRLQVHDFFTPQPISNASLFMVKNVLHNWSEPYTLKILTHLRNAATSDTVLLILADMAAPNTLDSIDFGFEIKMISKEQDFMLHPPTILSTGYTAANDTSWMVDAGLMAVFNAQRHTLHEMARLLKNTGWAITRVILSSGFTDSVQATPA